MEFRPLPRWLSNWLARHQHPVSLWLHIFGIPLTIAAVALALVQLADDRWDLWWRPVVLLVVGYMLQWMGHRIEGNDMGEIILVKKLLGRPYIAISPRYGHGPASAGDRSNGICFSRIGS
jgi:hypothetical protein